MVCMVSRMGFKMASKRSLWELSTPSTTPMIIDSTTAIPINARVCMAGSHMPTPPQNSPPTTVNIASGRPP